MDFSRINLDQLHAFFAAAGMGGVKIFRESVVHDFSARGNA